MNATFRDILMAKRERTGVQWYDWCKLVDSDAYFDQVEENDSPLKFYSIFSFGDDDLYYNVNLVVFYGISIAVRISDGYEDDWWYVNKQSVLHAMEYILSLVTPVCIDDYLIDLDEEVPIMYGIQLEQVDLQ